MASSILDAQRSHQPPVDNQAAHRGGFFGALRRAKARVARLHIAQPITQLRRRVIAAPPDPA